MNKKITFEMVAEMLKDYKNQENKALILHYEIVRFTPVVSGEDMIDMMMAHAAFDEHVQEGKISDKTGRIAISYSDKVYEFNLKYREELEQELISIQDGLNRLKFYINLLDEKYSNILKDLYIEGMTFYETAEKERLSISAVKNNRRAAINKLVEMYNLVTE